MAQSQALLILDPESLHDPMRSPYNWRPEPDRSNPAKINVQNFLNPTKWTGHTWTLSRLVYNAGTMISQSAALCYWHGNSVCLSVRMLIRLTITLAYCVKAANQRIFHGGVKYCEILFALTTDAKFGVVSIHPERVCTVQYACET